MEHVVGIDLGTTFSAIAFVNEQTGRPEILPDPETQERLTPSVVLFEGENNVIVGRIAKENAIAEPLKVVEFVKRSMGTDWAFSFAARRLSPQEVSAYILKKLKRDAEDRLGHEISKAVITVPAYFGEPQRVATKEAGEIAGLEVLEILDEPVAAALAYGLERIDSDQTVFVFDLGGGTFDVAIIEIKEKQIREIAIDGDYGLGGKDWDDALITALASRFEKKYGSRPLEDLASYQDLQLRSIRAKEELSRKEKTRVTVQHAGNMCHEEFSRKEFEELTKPLVDRCEMKCESVLAKAGKAWADIDTVLLVGGATRMPMVTQMLESISGLAPSSAVNVDQCVAEGAAWEALIVHTGSEPPVKDEWAAANPAVTKRIDGLDVKKITSHEIGVIAFDDQDRKRSFLMVPRFTPVPHTISDDTFRTRTDNQDSIEVKVTLGGMYLGSKDCDPEACQTLGQVIVDGIPPHPAGSPVEVTLEITEGKEIVVSGRDVLSGLEATATIKVETSLTKEKLEEAQRALRKASVTS